MHADPGGNRVEGRLVESEQVRPLGDVLVLRAPDGVPFILARVLADDAFAPMLPALRAACPGLATVIHAGDGPAPDGALSPTRCSCRP